MLLNYVLKDWLTHKGMMFLVGKLMPALRHGDVDVKRTIPYRESMESPVMTGKTKILLSQI